VFNMQEGIGLGKEGLDGFTNLECWDL